MARAAEAAMDLKLVVLGVGEERMELEPALQALGEDWLLIGLCGADGMICGLAGLDGELRAAVVELQTTGNLRAKPADPRPITSTDAALAMPLVDALIGDLVDTAGGTQLEGWADGMGCLRRLSGADAARLVLPEELYRLARLTLDLGGEGRQGALFLMLPADGPSQAEDGQAEDGWNATLRSAVLSAPATLTAVLHRFELPYAGIEAFEVGQVLPLPGVTVRSVRLECANGQVQAHGRLGQASGLRAVRIEERAEEEMQEVPIGGAGGGMGAAPAGLSLAGGGMPMAAGGGMGLALGDAPEEEPSGVSMPGLGGFGGAGDSPAEPEAEEQDQTALAFTPAPGLPPLGGGFPAAPLNLAGGANETSDEEEG
ncbi:FliM/FliN family flagellar motor switch protein [Pseudoroseicyclus sp. H15]